ncbi:MAG: DUF296 domain-containing protein, partial [Sulfolobales archaeon]|nr:DUF296 domain-containing protein [Sulfolobales archaeon]
MFNIGRVYLFRIPEDVELIQYLTKFARERGIRAGLVSGIGALKNCTLGFYDQKEQKYEYIKVDEEVELSGLQGNISIRENEPFIHVHAIV